MIGWIPTPYRMAAAGIVALLACMAGVVGGAWMAARHFGPQLAEANRKAGEFKHAYLTLAESTGRQNAAIQAEQDAGEERRKKALAAAEQAHGAALGHYGKGGVILGLKLQPGVDPCAAAREAFDAELREERGRQ